MKISNFSIKFCIWYIDFWLLHDRFA